MGKIFAVVLLLAGCETVSRDPICKIPVPLPPWNGLVLSLWSHGTINDETFLKNFPISGESGDKTLFAQGYNPEELDILARCLVRYFSRHAHHH